MKKFYVFLNNYVIEEKMEFELIQRPAGSVLVSLEPKNDAWEYSPAEYPDIWMFKVEQENVPASFNPENAKNDAMAKLKSWYPRHVHTAMPMQDIESGFHYLTGCEVKKIAGYAQVVMKRSCACGVGGNSYVYEVKGKSRIDGLYGNARVESLTDRSSIGTMYGQSVIRNASGQASVAVMGEKARICKAVNTSVLKMEDESKIDIMDATVKVHSMKDRASVNTGEIQPWQVDKQLMLDRLAGKTKSCGVPKTNIKLPQHMITDGILSA